MGKAFCTQSIQEQLSRDIFIHMDTINIAIFGTVQLFMESKMNQC